MDTLDKLLAKEFLLFFVTILGGLALLYLGIDFFSNIWELKLSTAKIFELYGYKLPGILQQFLPVACLMSTLLVVSNMSRQKEILALYAGGVGPFRILSTFVAFVALVSTASFLIFDPLVPFFNRRQTLVRKGLDPNSETLLSPQRGGFWYRSGNLIYNVGQFIPQSNTIEDLHVYSLSPGFVLRERLHARRAQWGGTDWELSGGYAVKLQEDGHFLMSEPFDKLRGVIPDKPSDFKTLKVQEDMMRLKDLRKYIQRNSAYGFDTTSQRVQYHERLALVFTPIVFVLLGLPLALKPLSSHAIPKSIAFCFLAVFVYLLFFRMTLSIGKGGHIPPLIAGWAPNMLFLTISSVLMARSRYWMSG